MTLWWPNAFQKYPWRTWFWERRPGEDDAGLKYREWPPGYYWFYKIPPEAGHKQQLAFRSPTTRRSYWGYVVEANVLYIITYPSDTPNWGSTDNFVEISPPCGNWYSDVYRLLENTRDQTVKATTAISAQRARSYRACSAVAKISTEQVSAYAALQAIRERPVEALAAIQATPERQIHIRSAVRIENQSEVSAVSAVAIDFEANSKADAVIRGNPIAYVYCRCAIKGDTQTRYSAKAFVVLSRADKILLEMENLWPQEFDLRSVPNAPSEFRNWRNVSLEELYAR